MSEITDDEAESRTLISAKPLFLGSAPLADRAVPEGWKFERADKRPFKRINIHSPRGHRLCVDSIGRGVEGALYLLADHLLSTAPAPPAAPTGEVEARPCCGEYKTCGRPCTPRGKEMALAEAARLCETEGARNDGITCAELIRELSNDKDQP